MGIIEEIGPGVTLLKPGDRVVMPFNVACGSVIPGRLEGCVLTATQPVQELRRTEDSLLPRGQRRLCRRCLWLREHGRVSCKSRGSSKRRSRRHRYQGGQAQYIRVPYADFNALKLPPGTEHEADFALLADIFPTGWHGLELAGFKAGESVAVWGAGPVGLMAAYSGVLRGASKVYVVDRVPERLAAAEKIGCVAVDFSKVDPVAHIIQLNKGMVDRAVSETQTERDGAY